MPIVEADTKALIVKDGKIIILKDHTVKGKVIIDIPGGRMHYGLTPEENLKREVKEELSIDVEVKDVIGVWYFFQLQTHNNQVICITYLCKPLSDVIDLGNNPDPEEKIGEYLSVTPEEFMQLKGDTPESLERLKKVVKKHFNLK